MIDELIIAEKPTSARKIAHALSQGKVETKRHRRVPYFLINRDGKRIVVVSAAGHLFGLAEKEKNGWSYPVFEVAWFPLYKISRNAKYTRDYIELIRKLAKDAKSFVIATDLDIEGETIGYNILRFLCNSEDAKRMKFSTLTKSDLVKAYKNASSTILKKLAEAGVTRHILDYYWGINISRALTLAMKKAGMYRILSSGRVQGPALKIVYEREKQIREFKPKVYWKLSIQVEGTVAEYESGRVWEEEVAKRIENDVKASMKARVERIERKKYRHLPPAPFNLNDLQAEVYSLFKLTPKQTQEIAQSLYEKSLISYPRTSSQKLPATLNLRRIIEMVGSQKKYAEICKSILKKRNVKPREGKKDDEAHPAIHPTGELPKNLSKNEKKIYDLIVRRFLSCFMPPAIKIVEKVYFNASNHIFIAVGKKTVENGWYSCYAPYLRYKDGLTGNFKEGEVVAIEKVINEMKTTQPPERYNPASLVRELEKRGLGTKATRGEIVQSLYDREYVTGRSMKITPLGEQVVTTLSDVAEKILDEELTREFEKKLELIKKGEVRKEVVVKEAKETLETILKNFKKNESKVGEELLNSFRETERKNSILGKCRCGGNLIMRKSKSNKRFVSCDTYPSCKISYPLPKYGTITPTKNVCEQCGTPLVKIVRRGKRPWITCLDPACESKKNLNRSQV